MMIGKRRLSCSYKTLGRFLPIIFWPAMPRFEDTNLSKKFTSNLFR